jgi:hypothetical protein
MIFIDNKYTRIYYEIVERAKIRELGTNVYKEKHHVIPRSIGGDNSKQNIVALTAREHFICHWLLVKMTYGKEKRSMSHALRMMLAVNPARHPGRYIPNSKKYELIKKIANEASKGRPCSTETREKIRQGNLRRPLASEETRAKLSAAAKRRKGFTPEGRAKVVESNKSRVWTQEMKDKLRAHNLGKTNVTQKGIPQEKLTCPFCNLTGGKSAMKHWHFNKCKLNNAMRRENR